MKVVIIDDHPVVRKGIEDTLEFEHDIELIGSAATYESGVKLITEKDPDIAIVDLRLPEKSGIELIAEASKLTKGCRYLILTSYASQDEVTRAISHNIHGYVLKDAHPDELLEAVRTVSSGRKYYAPEVVDIVMNKQESSPFADLTDREKDILKALADGLSNKVIAEKLFLSENTVKKHICNILQKLELEDRTQAALLAYSEGLGGEGIKSHA